MREILTSELTVDDVPPSDADDASLLAFALTFNGYRRVGGVPVLGQIADGVRVDLDNGGEPDLNLVRAACFYLARAADNSQPAESKRVIDDELRPLVAHVRRRLEDGPSRD